MKRISHFIFLVLIFKFFFVTSSALAWKLPIEIATVSDDGKKAYNKLVIGIESSATDGFDNLWDTPAILSHPDPDSPLLLRAYITPPPNLPPQGGEEKVLSPLWGEGQGGGGEAEMDRLWKDIRSTTSTGDTVWEIAVDSVPKGKAVDISWNVPQGLLKAGERLVLRDNDRIGTDGKPAETDMTWASTYSFVSESEEPRSLSLVLSRETVKRSRSGSGSGFGCGTVRGTHKGGPSGDGTAILGIIVLFSPLLFLRLLRCMIPPSLTLPLKGGGKGGGEG